MKNSRTDIVQKQKEEVETFIEDDTLQHEAHKRFRYRNDEIELTASELSRVDDIYNAVFMAMQEVCEDDTPLDWDMKMIGPIADQLVNVLKRNGHKASYPGFKCNDDGTTEYLE